MPPPTRHTLSLCLMSPPSYFDREQTEFVEAVTQGEWLDSLLLDESGRKRLVCGVPRQYLSPYLGLKSESQDRLMDLRRRSPPPRLLRIPSLEEQAQSGATEIAFHAFGVGKVNWVIFSILQLSIKT